MLQKPKDYLNSWSNVLDLKKHLQHIWYPVENTHLASLTKFYAWTGLVDVFRAKYEDSIAKMNIY